MCNVDASVQILILYFPHLSYVQDNGNGVIEFDEFREFLGFEDWIPPPSDTMDASGEPLPPGWVSRESQSRPGKLSYETGRREHHWNYIQEKRCFLNFRRKYV